jgi:hypothetical protein
MFTSTLKRTAATLGVLAGLLAAAGPASAQLPADAGGVTAPHTGPKAPASAKTMAEDSWTAANAPGAWTWHEAARTGVVTNTNDPDTMSLAGISSKVEPVELVGAEARGTQVGSEGVKDNGMPLETVSFTFKGEVIGLEPNALGTQVGSEGVKAANNLRGEAIDIIP